MKKTYLVGGAVRDQLLGLEPKDLDYVLTGYTPDEMIKSGFSQVGADFPVFLHPETKDEYALARIERKTGDGYQGFDCDFDTSVTIEDDLSRRDLTINSMAISLEDKLLVDPFNGQQDIENKVLRHTTNAFQEDPLRILRICRFAARYPDFTIAEETMDLMKSMVKNGDINHLTPERVWAEIQKVFQENKPSIFFNALKDCNALSVLFPEIDAMDNIPQRNDYHAEGDVFVHTMMVLDKGADICSKQSLNDNDRIDILASCLWHDVGKAHTPNDLLYHSDGSVKGYHHGHDDKDLVIPIIDGVYDRLKMPKKTKQFVVDVALMHQKIHAIKVMSARGIVKMFNEYSINNKGKNDYIHKIGLACYADSLGRLLNVNNQIVNPSDKYENKDLLKKYYQAYLDVDIKPWIEEYKASQEKQPPVDVLKSQLHQLRVSSVKRTMNKKKSKLKL